MSCEARTYADGSWFCQKCGIGGDKDEPVEEFCMETRRLNGSTCEDEGCPHYGTAHSHPADR